MIQSIEALNFRCLHYIDQPLQNFHVLVGPNGSGKTTFLDTVGFLGDFVSGGLEKAVMERTSNFRDMVWGRQEGGFQIGIELQIPEILKKNLKNSSYDTVRYEVEISMDSFSNGFVIGAEKVLFKNSSENTPPENNPLFPPDTIISPKGQKNIQPVINKNPGGNDNFYDERGKGWDHSFKLGPLKSSLANLPEDEMRFPVSIWLKGILIDGVQKLILNSGLMQKPSPPLGPKGFKPDGSNLPWVIQGLIDKHPDKHKLWVEHLKSVITDLEDVQTIERPEDRHRFIKVRYKNNLEVPSWMVSDGTLRLFALTLPAYLPELQGIYLIEEPENGIHPRAMEAVFQSLSSVYEAQILLATHSPVILSVAEPAQVMCFSKTGEGATEIVLGKDHPKLVDWKGEPNLSVYFAGGVLG